MGRAMQKVNDLYDSYYELYSMFEDDFENARGLYQECETNARKNCMIDG